MPEIIVENKQLREASNSKWAARVYHRNQEERIPPEIRKRVLRRDGRQCARCGSRKLLEVHHIVPRSENGSLKMQNLMTLCRDCHDEIEPLGIRDRNVIENWGMKKDTIVHKPIALGSEDWSTWVYGGYTRPKWVPETDDECFVSVTEKMNLLRLTPGAVNDVQ